VTGFFAGFFSPFFFSDNRPTCLHVVRRPKAFFGDFSWRSFFIFFFRIEEGPRGIVAFLPPSSRTEDPPSLDLVFAAFLRFPGIRLLICFLFLGGDPQPATSLWTAALSSI